jgi:hypothetical protein
VRHALGIDFSGGTYSQIGLLANVELEVSTERYLPTGTLRLNLTSGGFVGIFDLGNGRHRLLAQSRRASPLQATSRNGSGSLRSSSRPTPRWTATSASVKSNSVRPQTSAPSWEVHRRQYSALRGQLEVITGVAVGKSTSPL